MKRCLLARVSRCQYLLNQENWLEKVETTIGTAACIEAATARSDIKLGTNWTLVVLSRPTDGLSMILSLDFLWKGRVPTKESLRFLSLSLSFSRSFLSVFWALDPAGIVLELAREKETGFSPPSAFCLRGVVVPGTMEEERLAEEAVYIGEAAEGRFEEEVLRLVIASLWIAEREAIEEGPEVPFSAASWAPTSESEVGVWMTTVTFP